MTHNIYLLVLLQTTIKTTTISVILQQRMLLYQ